MPGNLSGWTDVYSEIDCIIVNEAGRTDGRTCCKMVTVGRVDQRTHVQVERGYFRLRTDRQPEYIMLPVPKGGGIKNNQVRRWSHFSTFLQDAFRVWQASNLSTLCSVLPAFCAVITLRLWCQQPTWHSSVGIKLLKFHGMGTYWKFSFWYINYI